MKKAPLLFLAAASIAGCTQNMEITKAPVEVQRTAGFATQNYVGHDQSVIRSHFAKDEETGEKKAEFSGANCALKGRGFSTSFTTPAIVNLPDYDYYSQPVTGSCSVNGETRPIVLRPYNETVRARKAAASNSGAQGGLLGMVVTGVVSGIVEAANDPTDDDWDYGNYDVIFPRSAAPEG